MNEQAALPNMEFIRQLIAEARKPESVDIVRLRMLQGTGMGTDSIPTKKGDE
jgi:hypothetical protein